MRTLLSITAITLVLASPALAQPVHYPIITHTGNVTIIETGVEENFAGTEYMEYLYIMGPWQGYNNPMVDSESAEWFPVVAVTPPPPPPVVPPPIVCLDCNPPPPPCLDCNPPPPCLTCGPPVVSVPETSTWVMLLLGFTGLGFAGLRRRTI